MDDFENLPRHVRRAIAAKGRKLMSDLGISPQVDEKTGQVVYDFEAACKALGLDPTKEIERADVRKTVYAAPGNRIKPLQ